MTINPWKNNIFLLFKCLSRRKLSKFFHEHDILDHKNNFRDEKIHKINYTQFTPRGGESGIVKKIFERSVLTIKNRDMDLIFFQIQGEICIGLGKLLKVRISYSKGEIFMKMRKNIPGSPHTTLLILITLIMKIPIFIINFE